MLPIIEVTRKSGNEKFENIDKTLYNMGMKNVSKPVEVLFKPSDDDFAKMKKAIEKLVGFIDG